MIPWNIPATEGDEYGEHDYYYTEIPENNSHWLLGGYVCDQCKRRRVFCKEHNYYFITLGGYDGSSETYCIPCAIKNELRSAACNILKFFYTLKVYLKLRKGRISRIKSTWELASKLYRKGRKIK